MAKSPGLVHLKLGDAASLPPEGHAGLNIEGLAEYNGGLLLGLRNPLQAGGKAPLIPLLNPAAVLTAGAAPSFGSPILLDLGGRGVRSIERVKNGYAIVAGPVADTGTFSLYRWSGVATDPAKPSTLVPPADLVPEAAIYLAATGHLMLLSDDGSINKQATCGSKAKLSQTFRAIMIATP
jgi:hypothetical protein